MMPTTGLTPSTGLPSCAASGLKAGSWQLSQREQSEPGVCGQGVQPQGVFGLFFAAQECGALGLSCGPGLHIGPRFVGATGIIAQVEPAGSVPSLTCTG